MARPYSSDLRERVIEAVNEGAPRSEAAERFGVSISTAVRWHQGWRETGTFEAKPCGGSRSPLEDYTEEIIALVEEQRDPAGEEGSALFPDHVVIVCTSPEGPVELAMSPSTLTGASAASGATVGATVSTVTSASSAWASS